MCLTVRHISAKVMPHGCGVIWANGQRGVIERRQQISPDIVDFRGGFSHGIQHIGRVLKGQSSVSRLHFRRRDILVAYTDRLCGAGENVTNELQDAIGIIIGVLHRQKRIINLFAHLLFYLPSIR